MSNTGPFTVSVDLGIALSRLVADENYKKPKIALRLDQPLTLGQLIKQLGIPEKYIGFVTVNGEKRGLDTVTRPGDNIILFPYITGG